MSVCHLSLSAAPALWLNVREAEVGQAVVAAAVHRSIQTLESYRGERETDGKYSTTLKRILKIDVLLVGGLEMDD